MSVSLELDENGNVVEINNISSIHNKDAEKEIKRLSKLGEDGLKKALLWVNKEKVLDWFGIADLFSPIHTNNPELNSVAKVINDYENPKLSGEKITEESKKSDSEQGDDGRLLFSDGDNAEVEPQSAEPSGNGGGGRERGPRYNPRDLSRWNPLEGCSGKGECASGGNGRGTASPFRRRAIGPCCGRDVRAPSTRGSCC